MPCDPEPITYADAKRGDALVTETGAVMIVDPELRYSNIKGYVSHFATCPDAKTWRRK